MGDCLNHDSPDLWITVIEHNHFPSSPSADKLRAKAGRTMVACADGGALANLAEAEEWANEVEVRFSSPWFCPLCRVKACAAKKPLCWLDVIRCCLFFYLYSLSRYARSGYFSSRKSKGPPAAKSGYTPGKNNLLKKCNLFYSPCVLLTKLLTYHAPSP